MTLYQCYKCQKNNARRRGIPWDLSFTEWSAIWGEKIHKRGRGRDQLCMARKGDVGPYAVGNVKIITNAENVKEQQHTDDRRKRVSDSSKSLWENDEHRQRMSRCTSKRNSKQWNDYNYRSEMTVKLSDSAKRRWSEPDKRAAIIAAQNAGKRDPGKRAENSARIKAKWADPEYRAKMLAAQRTARARGRASVCQS
jgi:hypothetical protein